MAGAGGNHEFMAADNVDRDVDAELFVAADVLRMKVADVLGGAKNISPNKTWAVFAVPASVEKDKHDTTDHAQLLVAHIGPTMSKEAPDAKPAVRIARLAITEARKNTPRHALVEDVFLSGDNRCFRRVGGTLLDAEGFAYPEEHGSPLTFNAEADTDLLYTSLPLAHPPGRDTVTAKIGRLWPRKRTVSLSSPDNRGALQEALPVGGNLLDAIAGRTPLAQGTEVVEPHWQ